MLRKMMLAFAAAGLCACAPGPAAMSATQASEMLELFAAGHAPGDVCTPQGRALLRGAGLTKLRCLEQSGAVVFERDLGP